LTTLFPNNLRSVKNTVSDKDRNSESSGLYIVNTDNGEASEKQIMSQLQEMEELNIHLGQLLDQRTAENAEVVATNTKFISILSHDLRSPFSSILGVLQILKKSLNDYDKDEFEKYIDIASDSANRTLNLLDELLEWTISQNFKKSFNPVKINLKKLIEGEIENMGFSAIQKQIKLTHYITSTLYVIADLQMIKTVLRNLISNAVKYSNTRGEIIISASEIRQFVEIAVKDNGIGISLEARKSLFKIDSFHTTKGTNNEKGNGLGLILCKEFIETHGGKIRIESEPDRGSKVTFTLPHYL
jgi:signal transduction histidine kinase